MKRKVIFILLSIFTAIFFSACATIPAPISTTALPVEVTDAIEPIATTMPSDTPELVISPSLEITDKYLLTFHACDTLITNCHDWQNHQVYLAQGNDGVQWSIVPGWVPYSGSVPDVIRRGETIYLYTPGQLVRYHLDTGLLEKPINVSVKGAEGFVDPSIIVDDQGRLTLFFLFGRIGGDPAACMPEETSCENRFGSATEVEGSDGANFILDEGDRVIVPLSVSGPIRTASDPDVFFDGTLYYLYIAYGPSISVWTSSELRGTYVQSADLPGGMLNNDSGGVASGYYDPETKRYWTFAHFSDQNQLALIHRAAQTSLTQQIIDPEWITISSESVGLAATMNIESPGFAINQP